MGTVVTRILVAFCATQLVLPAGWCCHFGCCESHVTRSADHDGSEPCACCRQTDPGQSEKPAAPAPTSPKPCCEAKDVAPPNDFNYTIQGAAAPLLPPLDPLIDLMSSVVVVVDVYPVLPPLHVFQCVWLC